MFPVVKLFLVVAFALLVMKVLCERLKEGADDSKACGSRTIQCVCGIGDRKRFLTLVQKAKPKSSDDAEDDCTAFPDPYLDCGKIDCVLAPNQTFASSPLRSDKVKRNIVDSFYPQVLMIPSGSPHQRLERQAEACAIPTLKNAAIKCWKWPNWMNCDITCIYGYALPDKHESMASVNINCRNTENVWKPHGFIDCLPYLNCKAHLTKPGDLKCKEPVDAPAFCEISCMDYDQYEATSLQKYECVDENFVKTLPHCATLKEVELVKRPKRIIEE